jgi:hypothetical protein
MLSLVRYLLKETPYEGKTTRTEKTALVATINEDVALETLEKHHPTDEYSVYRYVRILEFSPVLEP